MKISDLMAGDWINVFNTPKQIEGIKKFQNGDEIVYYDGDNGNFMKNVTPILLTKEILLKNGFEEFCEGCIIKELSDDEIPTLYIWNGSTNSICIVDYYSTNKYTYIKECKYVHEFQHELKSCGIEKEIVL